MRSNGDRSNQEGSNRDASYREGSHHPVFLGSCEAVQSLSRRGGASTTIMSPGADSRQSGGLRRRHDAAAADAFESTQRRRHNAAEAALPETAALSASPSVSVLTCSDTADVSENAASGSSFYSQGSSGDQRRRGNRRDVEALVKHFGGDVEGHSIRPHSIIPDPAESPKATTVLADPRQQQQHHRGSTSPSPPSHEFQAHARLPSHDSHISDAMLASLDSTTLQKLLQHLASMGAAARPRRPGGETPSGTTDLFNMSGQHHITAHGPIAANAGPLAANAGPLPSVQPLAKAPRNATEAVRFKSAAAPSVRAASPDQIISDPAGGSSSSGSSSGGGGGGGGGGLRFYYFSFPNGVCGFFQAADEQASLGSTHAAAWPEPSTTTICPHPAPLTHAEARPEPSTTMCPNLGSGNVNSFPDSHALADVRSSDDGSSWPVAYGGLSEQAAAWVGMGALGDTCIVEGHGGEIQISTTLTEPVVAESSSHPRYAPLGPSYHAPLGEIWHDQTAAAELPSFPFESTQKQSSRPSYHAPLGGIRHDQTTAAELSSSLHVAAATTGMEMVPSGRGCGTAIVACEPTARRIEIDDAVNGDMTTMLAHQNSVSSVVPTAPKPVDLQLHAADAAADRTSGATECAKADSLFVGGCDDYTSLLLMDPLTLVDSLPYPFTAFDPPTLAPGANMLTGISPRGNLPRGIFSTAFETLQSSPRGNLPRGGFSTAAQAAACGELASMEGQNGGAEEGEGLLHRSQDFMAQEELFQALLLEEGPEMAAKRLLSVACGAEMRAEQPGESSEYSPAGPAMEPPGDPSGDPTVHSSRAFLETTSAPGGETSVTPQNAGDSCGTGVALGVGGNDVVLKTAVMGAAVVPEEEKQEGGKQQKKRKKAQVVSSMQGGQQDAAAAVKVAFLKTTSTRVAEACGMPRNTEDSSDAGVALAVGASEAASEMAVVGAAGNSEKRAEGVMQQKKRKKTHNKAEQVPSMQGGQQNDAAAAAAAGMKVAFRETKNTTLAEACGMQRNTGDSGDTGFLPSVGGSEAVLKTVLANAAVASEGSEEGSKQQKKRKKAQKKDELVSSMEGGQLDGVPLEAALQAKKAKKQKVPQGSKTSRQGNGQPQPSSAASAAPEPAPACLDSAVSSSAAIAAMASAVALSATSSQCLTCSSWARSNVKVSGPGTRFLSGRQLSRPLARKCEVVARRSLRHVVAEKGSTSDLVSTAVKIGNDGLDAATKLVPASIPRPVAKGGVALLSLAILLSLVQTIFNTFVSLLFLGGLGYLAFQYLSKDGKNSSGSSAMDAQKIAELKAFVQLCQKTPAILADPKLEFFRDYLESLNAEVPGEAYGLKTGAAPKAEKVEEPSTMESEASKVEEPEEEEEEEEEPEIVESDVEIDEEGVVEGDDDPPQQMGDASKEVGEEQRDAAQAAKAKAIEALAEDNLEAAVAHLTEAILNNPTSALLYGNRAGVFVRMKKPNAAIRDCDEALKLNPDSARAYKSRGEAKALLGQWEAAAADLRLASRLDYDEEVNSFLKLVEPRAHRLEEHRRKYERLRKEREERVAAKERQRRRKAAQKAYEEEKKREEERKNAARGAGGGGGFPGGFPAGMGGMPGGFPGGMPAGMGGMGGMGGMPGMGGGAGGMPDMSQMLNDPELLMALQNPAVMAAMQDVMKNPANLLKYQNDPTVGPVLMKLMSKFGGGAGGAGGM
ncbi:unnamed protein product [Closterium sp. Yama58-4]|nr:unnamed protein product [Closterium sp. Yama58-4]